MEGFHEIDAEAARFDAAWERRHPGWRRRAALRETAERRREENPAPPPQRRSAVDSAEDVMRVMTGAAVVFFCGIVIPLMAFFEGIGSGAASSPAADRTDPLGQAVLVATAVWWVLGRALMPAGGWSVLGWVFTGEARRIAVAGALWGVAVLGTSVGLGLLAAALLTDVEAPTGSFFVVSTALAVLTVAAAAAHRLWVAHRTRRRMQEGPPPDGEGPS